MTGQGSRFGPFTIINENDKDIISNNTTIVKEARRRSTFSPNSHVTMPKPFSKKASNTKTLRTLPSIIMPIMSHYLSFQPSNTKAHYMHMQNLTMYPCIKRQLVKNLAYQTQPSPMSYLFPSPRA